MESEMSSTQEQARRTCWSPSASIGSTALRTSCSPSCARECPVHWTAASASGPTRRASGRSPAREDIHTVSRDWKTYSSELGGVTATTTSCSRSSSRGRCSSAWTRPSTTASRCSSRPASRPSGSPPTSRPSARSSPTCSTAWRAARQADLVTDVAQPIVSRVIGSFMGIPPEDDHAWATLMNSALGIGDPDLSPEGARGSARSATSPRSSRRCQRDDRRSAASTRPTT